MTALRYVLDELMRLVSERAAIFKLTVTSNYCKASFKRPGAHAEIAVDSSPNALHDVLRDLLRRLGVYHDLPTIENLIEKMTPPQRARMERLVAEHQQLKREIVDEHERVARASRVENVEPVLASPRSSLNPQLFDATFEVGDERDG